MTSDNIIDIIQKHSLTIRCLPYKVIHHWSYREGDENKKYVDCKGNPSKSRRSLVISEDGRKLLREERDVENGGWWFVHETKNTNATVMFSKKYDKFFAPTLEEALQLYLDSIK
jgi:hypothetical protein